MKNIKTIIVLFVILLVLGGVATWDEWMTEKEKKADENKNKLVAVDLENAIAIEWQDPKKTDFVGFKLEKKDGKWMIVSPISAPADENAVRNVINTLKDYKYEKSVAESSDKHKEFGLVKGEARVIQLTLKDGEKDKKVSIYIGMKAPVGYSVYSRTTESDTVYIGSQYLETGTAKILKDFRQKKFINIDLASLTSVMPMSVDGESIKIEKLENAYKITTPITDSADKLDVESYVRGLNEARAQEFADAPLDPAMKEAILSKEGQFKVSWTFNDETSKTLLVNKFKEDYWAMFEGEELAYKVSAEFTKKIAKKLIDFRNRRVFDFDSADVKEITIDEQTFVNVHNDWYEKTQAEKLDEKGQPISSDNPPDKASFVRSLLVDLEFSKTDRFIEAGDDTFKSLLEGDESHRLRIVFKEKKEPIEIKVWKLEKEAKYLLKKSGGDKIYRVSDTLIDDNLKAMNKTGQTSLNNDEFEKEAG